MATMPNLFDFAAQDHALTPDQRKQLERTAREAGQKRKGHAWMPGSGPAGETCGGCQYYVRKTSGARRVFRKCKLMEAHWTHGPGSDIRAKDAACKFWEADKPEVRAA
jgi:hypothetical protein